MSKWCRSSVGQTVKLLAALTLIAALASLSTRSMARSYNVNRWSVADLGGSNNGYICGYERFVYVSKWARYAIVDLENPSSPQIFGPHIPDPDNASEGPGLGHGKACMWMPPGGGGRIHLVLPSRGSSEDDASIYVIDVTEPSSPVLKGRIEGIPNLKNGMFYSAFVARGPHTQGPVWVFAAAPIGACNPFPTNCNDTVYIFDIAPILSAPLDDPVGIITEPYKRWWPGCNPGFPPSPDSARGHDVTVHDNILLVTNPGGGLYVVDTSPLQNGYKPQELGRCEYEHAMTHDGWITKNMDFVYTTDEHFLEWGCQRPIGDVTVYDIQGLGALAGGGYYTCNLTQVGKYAPSTAVTSHYCYIDEDVGYVANYNRGLRIIDVSVPTDPIEVGYYDTYLGPDIPSHLWPEAPVVHGTWHG